MQGQLYFIKQESGLCTFDNGYAAESICILFSGNFHSIFISVLLMEMMFLSMFVLYFSWNLLKKT